MSILNRASDGLLTVLLALRRALIAHGPLPESELLALCAPAAVSDGKMARQTLIRWKQLGFFEEHDGCVQLHAEIVGKGADDLDDLRAFVLRLVLADENNTLLTADPDADADKSLASDCTRALAWSLTQDPFLFQSIVGHPAVEELERRQGTEPRCFRNDTRWPGYKEWATFLGVAFPSKKGIVLNPAFAIHSVLPEVFGDAAELPQQIFFSRLSDVLPILDRGRYQEAVQAQVARPWRTPKESEISPCLSVALLTLEAKEELRLEARSDAPQLTLLGRNGRGFRSVSHVLRLGGPDA